jgi:hypothetical protein
MMTYDRTSLLLLLSLLLCGTPAVLAQTAPVVSSVRFSGNESVRSSTLETLVRIRSNRQLLGVPGLRPWLWANRLNPDWGEPPARLDRAQLAADIERLQIYYRSIGFLDNRIDTLVTEFGKDRVEVAFLITEGSQTEIRSVSFSGFPEFDSPTVRSSYLRTSSLANRRIDDTTYSAGIPLTYERIGLERTAILTYLKNQGHAAVTNDSIRAIVRRDPDNPNRADILYRISAGPTYTFGNIYLLLDGPGNTPSTVRIDSVRYGDAAVISRKEDDALTRFRLLYENLAITPGTPYNHEHYLLTVRRFQNLGMINVRQFSLSADGSLPDFDKTDLPVRIDMQTLPRQNIRADLSGIQRFGFGAGAGLTYTNGNLFGMAERLQVSVKGSFENALGANEDLLRSFESSMEYSVPRTTAPLRWVTGRNRFDNARTVYGVTLAQINQINFNVNANIRFNLRYDIQHRQTVSSSLDLIELDWFDASPTAAFRQDIIEQFADDPFLQERILADFSQQFNSTVRYTIRHFNTDIIKRNRGSYNEFSVESGGNIPWLIERYLVRPGERVQGSIPSFIFADSTLTYARFVKASIDHRRYGCYLSDFVLAWRIFAGAAYAYGETSQIPLNRRFFAGGASDIRGWKTLRLGPGDVETVSINGGDIKLATFLEARQLLFRNVANTDWHGALFADIGNTWYGPGAQTQRGKFRYDTFWKEAAVGIGWGVRLDWQYIVLRIDAAYKAYDPRVVDGRRIGWFQNPDPYIHFGIGHSF